MRLNDQEKKQLVVYDTRKEQPSIWNLQAFVIVFLFIMLGTTINVYSVNNDNLTWVDSNGDFKLDSYDHSMINLDTDLIELNNLTLNEVFEDFDEIDETYTSFNFIGANNTSIIDGVVKFTASYYNGRFERQISHVANDKIYLSANIKTISNKIQLRGRDSSYAVYHTGSGDFEYLSTITSSSLTPEYPRVADLRSSNFTETVIDGIWYINLTNLGIDNLTKSELDEYYDLYVSLQENRIEAYKDLGNEPISQWQNLTQMVSNLIDDILKPVNDVNNWINKFMQGLFS